MNVIPLEAVGVQCVDGGTCHHQCSTSCFRKEYCSPLSSATHLNPDWSNRVQSPAEIFKQYEQLAEFTLQRAQPIVARLDGRAFSSFTKNANKPYDRIVTDAMHDTLTQLCMHFNPLVGYTQSDEITLVWGCSESPIFNGRSQKLASSLAAYASVIFSQHTHNNKFSSGAKCPNIPTFDCRVFNVPDHQIAYNCLNWRQRDATKNAISSIARAHFGHTAIMNKHTTDMIRMLCVADHSIENYPMWFRYGMFCKKDIILVTPGELSDIPPQYMPKEPFQRSKWVNHLGILNQSSVDWVFDILNLRKVQL